VIFLKKQVYNLCQQGPLYGGSEHTGHKTVLNMTRRKFLSKPYCYDYMASVINERIWSTGGMKLTGENGSTWRKACPAILGPLQIPPGQVWYGTRESADRGRPLNRTCHDTAQTLMSEQPKICGCGSP